MRRKRKRRRKEGELREEEEGGGSLSGIKTDGQSFYMSHGRKHLFGRF